MHNLKQHRITAIDIAIQEVRKCEVRSHQWFIALLKSSSAYIASFFCLIVPSSVSWCWFPELLFLLSESTLSLIVCLFCFPEGKDSLCFLLNSFLKLLPSYSMLGLEETHFVPCLSLHPTGRVPLKTVCASYGSNYKSTPLDNGLPILLFLIDFSLTWVVQEALMGPGR